MQMNLFNSPLLENSSYDTIVNRFMKAVILELYSKKNVLNARRFSNSEGAKSIVGMLFLPFLRNQHSTQSEKL